jgi:hypothetical protein
MTPSFSRLSLLSCVPLCAALACNPQAASPPDQQVFEAPADSAAVPGSAAVTSGDSTAASADGAAEAPDVPAEDLALAAEPMKEGVETPFGLVPDMDKSSLSFVSTKNGGAEVGGTFAVILGGFDLDPDKLSATTGVLNVELDSVNTGLELRDTNIAETFFGRVVGKVVRSDVEFLAFRPEVEALPVGASTIADVDLRINLRGSGNLASAKVELTRTSELVWSMNTLDPVVLSISELGMQGRSDSLKERCGHASIEDKVTVSAQIVLSPPQ